MRIWSVHPKYFDSKGLVALWRETLLAQKVLLGNTRGYKNHPQLDRFKKTKHPIHTINYYLSEIYTESVCRGYHFNRNKFPKKVTKRLMTVTRDQLEYEFKHLLSKLKTRDTEQYHELKNLEKIQPHPIFNVVNGEIEDWEHIKTNN